MRTGVAAGCLLAGTIAAAAPARAAIALPEVAAWRLPPGGDTAADGARAWDRLAAADPVAPPTAPAYGPQPPIAPRAAPPTRLSFGRQAGAVGWEVGAFAAYLTAINVGALAKDGTRGFHFQDEGFFGRSTFNLGVDKLAHGFDTYLLAEVLRARIDRKLDRPAGSAVTAAVLASGLMAYGELFDGIKKTSGFSLQDLAFNTGGAAFSVLRHAVPGLSETLDFRVLVIPNSDVFTFSGQRHYRQQRYLLALKLAGFERLRASPLRYVELHAGYYAAGFTARERARGETPQRKPFVGVGLNLGELLFGRGSGTRVGRAADSVLDYVQVPYTVVQVR